MEIRFLGIRKAGCEKRIIYSLPELARVTGKAVDEGYLYGSEYIGTEEDSIDELKDELSENVLNELRLNINQIISVLEGINNEK